MSIAQVYIYNLNHPLTNKAVAQVSGQGERESELQNPRLESTAVKLKRCQITGRINKISCSSRKLDYKPKLAASFQSYQPISALADTDWDQHVEISPSVSSGQIPKPTDLLNMEPTSENECRTRNNTPPAIGSHLLSTEVPRRVTMNMSPTFEHTTSAKSMSRRLIFNPDNAPKLCSRGGILKHSDFIHGASMVHIAPSTTKHAVRTAVEEFFTLVNCLR